MPRLSVRRTTPASSLFEALNNVLVALEGTLTIPRRMFHLYIFIPPRVLSRQLRAGTQQATGSLDMEHSSDFSWQFFVSPWEFQISNFKPQKWCQKQSYWKKLGNWKTTHTWRKILHPRRRFLQKHSRHCIPVMGSSSLKQSPSWIQKVFPRKIHMFLQEIQSSVKQSHKSGPRVLHHPPSPAPPRNRHRRYADKAVLPAFHPGMKRT